MQHLLFLIAFLIFLKIFLFVSCVDPPTMLHASSAGGTSIGSVWKYTCEPGYEVALGRNEAQMQCSPMGNTWVLLTMLKIYSQVSQGSSLGML